MLVVYSICAFYLIFMSALTSGGLAKLVMLSGAVIATVSVLDNTFYTYPIWVTLFYSFLLLFTKAKTKVVQKIALAIRLVSIIAFISSIITLVKF